MRKITLIHPSRGRAELASKTATKWITKAKNPEAIEYFLSIEHDQLAEYRTWCKIDNTLVGNNKNAVEAINNAANSVDFDILVVISDDFDCPLHWDELLRAVIDDKTDFVLKTFDTTQHWIVTLPIMDKVYYKRFGYVYYPGYKHMFCDTELTTVAQYLDKLIIRNDVVFPHLTHTTNNDSINAKNNSTWNEGEKLYLDRYKQNFGVEKLKEISYKPHLDWVKNKLK